MRCWILLGILAMLAFAPSAIAQIKHDPLNPQEIDQLRDTALDAEPRLKLFVKFARARLASIDQMRADPKATKRAQQTHDLLEDFLEIYDELNDNIDVFVDRKQDLRKPLKTVIEADTEFQAKLRALKDSPESSASDAGAYQFVLSNAIESVDSGADDHRQLLASQDEAEKHGKKK